MKALISAKAVVGMISAAAISGSMVAGVTMQTSAMPEHWYFADSRVTRSSATSLASAPAASNACARVSSNPANHVANCPNVLVVAERNPASAPGAIAMSQDDSPEKRL